MRPDGHVTATHLVVWCTGNKPFQNRYFLKCENLTECCVYIQEDFVRRDGHVTATDLMVWCAGNEPMAPAPGKDDFHMETVCTLVNIIGNAARSSVKVLLLHRLCREPSFLTSSYALSRRLSEFYLS